MEGVVRVGIGVARRSGIEVASRGREVGRALADRVQVDLSPDGDAYLMTLSVDTNPGGFGTSPNAMLVMKSTDGGARSGTVAMY